MGKGESYQTRHIFETLAEIDHFEGRFDSLIRVVLQCQLCMTDFSVQLPFPERYSVLQFSAHTVRTLAPFPGIALIICVPGMLLL